MDYEETVLYIEDIPKFTKKHTFDHTREFLRRLGNPCCGRKILHVAGTNGKGSVCAYMQAILLSEGKTVGFFTSPHLVRHNERIKINGVDISDKEFVKVFETVREMTVQMQEEGIGHPSYFEFLYAMAMTAFEEAGVEYVILETGLGGRLDATNSFARPYLSVITSIGLDHTAILGDTIEQIAAEKAGIIKKGVPVFYDGNLEESSVVIERTAAKAGAPCRKISNDAFEILEITEKDIAFLPGSEYDNNTVWRVRGTGVYQVMNAMLAIAAMKFVFGDCMHLDKWRQAVETAQWPGRMEEILPGVILDGAHNLDAVERFVESVSVQKERETVVLFSAVAEKDYEHMIGTLCKGIKAKAYVIARLEDKRGEGARKLAEVFRQYTDAPVYTEKSMEEALALALKKKGENGRLYCLGSLYLIGELKRIIGGLDA